jgi:hypothetical protein
MSAIVKSSAALAALNAVLLFASPALAQAPSAAIAKECRAAAIKAHPPRPTGSLGTSAQAERDYYRKCIAERSRAR